MPHALIYPFWIFKLGKFSAHTAIHMVPEYVRRKMGEAEEDMTEYISRTPERDGCQLAWSPQDRQ